MRTDTLRSSLIAGVISAVIWIVITLATGGGAATVWLGGLIFFVGTAAVSYLIGTVVTQRRST
jgi:hypothetical protein